MTDAKDKSKDDAETQPLKGGPLIDPIGSAEDQDREEMELRSVEIKRGKERITTDVPVHEIEVLKAVHGEANVFDMGESPMTKELPSSAEAEYDRLARTYKNVNGPDVVRIAFPNGPRDLKGFGFQTGGKVQAQEGSQVKVRTPAKKSAKK